jgi:hypothetical protein
MPQALPGLLRKTRDMISSANINKRILSVTLILLLISAFMRFSPLSQNMPTALAHTDIKLFYLLATNPNVPFFDRTLEYPIIIRLFTHLMGFFGEPYPLNPRGYLVASSFFLISFAMASTYLVMILSKNLGITPNRVFSFWTLSPSIFLFTLYNWDIIAVFFSLASIYLYRCGRYKSSAFSLSLAVSSKLYPILFLPLLLVRLSKNQAYRFFAVFALSLLMTNLPAMLINFDTFQFVFYYNSIRPPNPDSIWGALMRHLPYLSVQQVNVISAAMFLLPYIYILAKTKEMPLEKSSAAAIALFLLANKVFSPQYLLWLTMFFALCPAIKPKIIYSLEYANLAVLFLIFSWIFGGQTQTALAYVEIAVLTRHLALLWLIASVLKDDRADNYAWSEK